jgi:hypothetical protein
MSAHSVERRKERELITSGEIGVNVVGLEEHGLTDLELDVVEEESNEETNVVGELAL